jgi:hypothetical protein
MRRCNLCGTTHDLTRHHVGGENFIAWFRMWLCTKCHDVLHARQRAAGIDLKFTPNAKIRLLRALKLTVLFLWLLLDTLEGEIGQQADKAKALCGTAETIN